MGKNRGSGHLTNGRPEEHPGSNVQHEKYSEFG